MTAGELEPRRYLWVLLLTALLGVVSAAITFAFMALVNLGQKLLWDQAAPAAGIPAPVFTLLICTLGGLLVGLLVKLFGDHSGIFAELMVDFSRTGRFNYRAAPGIVATAFVSLVMGGSLGPEAPLADACGGLGTWLSDKMGMDERERRTMGFSGVSGMLGAFITSPFGGALLGLESAHTGADYVWTLFPSLVASSFATVVFVALSGAFFGNLYTFPSYTPNLWHLFLAVPLGMVGALAGAIFIVSLDSLRKLMQPLKQHLVVRGLIGGLGMGLAGALLPLTLFSGEEQMFTLIQSAATVSSAVLIVLALVKLLATSLCLSTGWKGGYIFPIMFAGVALGMAINDLFPNIPVAVAVAATMAGAMVAVMKAPIFSALFVMTLVQREAAPVIAIAVIVGALATVKLSIVKPAQPESKPDYNAEVPV